MVGLCRSGRAGRGTGSGGGGAAPGSAARCGGAGREVGGGGAAVGRTPVPGVERGRGRCLAPRFSGSVSGGNVCGVRWAMAAACQRLPEPPQLHPAGVAAFSMPWPVTGGGRAAGSHRRGR